MGIGVGEGERFGNSAQHIADDRRHVGNVDEAVAIGIAQQGDQGFRFNGHLNLGHPHMVFHGRDEKLLGVSLPGAFAAAIGVCAQ